MKERLHKILAEAGVASRRKAEELIAAGRVTVNGKTAVIGQSAEYGSDNIEVDGKRLRTMPKKVYIMLNKPRGYVTTASDEKGRKTVLDLMTGLNCRVFPVGRLDLDSEGLLLLTNDGEWANALTHPSYKVDKEYLASVTGNPDDAVKIMSAGMDILDEAGEVEYHTAPARVRVRKRDAETAQLSVTIREGRNRQVRRMCEACGLKVRRLTRVAVGALTLEGLPNGKWRFLSDEELKATLPAEKKPKLKK